jgi:Flp pilus assembly protein TadD
MSNASPTKQTKGATTERRMTRRELLLLVVIALGLGLSATLSHRLEAQPAATAAQANEELYVKPEAARRMSLGFNGLVADWYWMRALQYVGRKVLAYQGDLQIDDLSPVGLTQLAPLLDNATTLDPQFIPAYEYGAVVLPAFDVEAAIKLVRKGIDANPQAWRLYHQLGYIYWQRGRFPEAAEAYRQGAQLAGAPAWMNAMAAQMAAQGGSRATAREIYRRMYEQTDDAQMRTLALRRLLQLQSWDERDALRRVLAAYRTRMGRCPANWREVAPVLRAANAPLDMSGAPLDPSGVPYVLAGDGCDVELSEQTQILRK